MKSIMFFLVSIVFAVFFAACNDDVETLGNNVPSSTEESVKVSLNYSSSPFLKDGDEDDDPEPMFDVMGIVTQNGNPVQAEVELVTVPENALVDSTNTDSYGGFGFYQVPSGSYNVVVIVAGNVADIIEVNL